MKKIIYLVLIFSLFLCCVSKQEKVGKIIEDGVEVVINHLEPFQIKGEPSDFSLEKEFSIDTEKDKIAELGLTDIGVYFDADSEGNIFLNNYENTESMIFQFDSSGNFIRSFACKGQGPGELQGRNFFSLRLTVDQDNNIVVSDFGNKLAVFRHEGDLIERRRLDSETICIIPLSNGNFLSYMRVMDPTAEFINQNPLSLINNQFEEINVLDKQIVPNPII